MTQLQMEFRLDHLDICYHICEYWLFCNEGCLCLDL